MNLREIDALVAEKVMGHTVEPRLPGLSGEYWDDTDGGIVSDYSSDIAAAWQVVEKFVEQVKADRNMEISFVMGFDGSHWEAGIWKHDEWYLGGGGYVHEIKADTAPLAICLAALKAVGVEVPA